VGRGPRGVAAGVPAPGADGDIFVRARFTCLFTLPTHYCGFWLVQDPYPNSPLHRLAQVSRDLNRVRVPMPSQSAQMPHLLNSDTTASAQMPHVLNSDSTALR
jgi:hypothetical protein